MNKKTYFLFLFKKCSLLMITFLFVFIFRAAGQQIEFPDYTPLSPKAFEFLKYGEIPPGAYNGIPNISIPLYSITADQVEIPLSLSYHAQGIRVSEEASQVGLGWSLPSATIVQIINDVDDFKENSTKKLPDYHNSPIPTEFPYRYAYPNNLSDGVGWYSPYPINETQPYTSFKIATDYYVPVDGEFSNQKSDIFISNTVDSEPDIFKANFLGHSLNFVRPFEPVEHFDVLNEKGYLITKTTTPEGFGFKITTPLGDSFFFEKFTEVIVTSNYSGPDFTGSPGSGGIGIGDAQQRIWHLTKIETSKGKEIVFNYIETSWVNNIINYSQKYQKSTQTGSTTLKASLPTFYKAYVNGSPNAEHLIPNSSVTKEIHCYLSTISFPEGAVHFTYSNRLDIVNAKKLDNIGIFDANGNPVKTIDFGYGYFIATENGNQHNTNDGIDAATENTHRLKLISIQESGKNPYTFTYNPVLLPKKTSFAQDYWGFYNGNTNNVSLIPDPERFGVALPTNGNNKSANLEFTKACVLEQISYPTGGKTTYEYGLNTFDNYWVPDYDDLNNTISKGNGLRVRKIAVYDSQNSISQKSEYQYSTGKDLLRKEFFISYNTSVSAFFDTGGAWGIDAQNKRSVKIDEVSLAGYFSPNIFGSGTGVGYDTVSVKQLDLMDIEKNGTVVSHFSNTPDIFVPGTNPMAQGKLTMPARESWNNPKNGSLLKQEFIKENGVLLKTVEHEYSVTQSDVYYGVKMAEIANYVYQQFNFIYTYIPQHLIGYYPIYGKKTLLTASETKTFFPSDTLVQTTNYIYNANNLLTNENYVSSNGKFTEQKTVYPHPGHLLYTKNMLNHPLQNTNHLNGQLMDAKTFEYDLFNGLPLISTIEYIKNGEPDQNRITFYNYDDKGNPLEIIREDGTHVCYIWGYGQTRLIAKLEKITYAAIDPITVSNLQSLSDGDIDEISEQSLRDALSTLRESYPDAMVTTFTHDPLIGVTSSTDPKGYTSFYTYDDFNRLAATKNTHNDLIESYNYNYVQYPPLNAVIEYGSAANDYQWFAANLDGGSGNFSYAWFEGVDDSSTSFEASSSGTNDTYQFMVNCGQLRYVKLVVTDITTGEIVEAVKANNNSCNYTPLNAAIGYGSDHNDFQWFISTVSGGSGNYSYAWYEGIDSSNIDFAATFLGTAPSYQLFIPCTTYKYVKLVVTDTVTGLTVSKIKVSNNNPCTSNENEQQ